MALKLVHFYFGVSRTFCYGFMGQQLPDGPRDLWPWPLILELTAQALIGDTGICAPSVYQIWSS